MWAGVALATLNWLIVPPVWMIARVCMPGRDAFAVLMRYVAVVLAFMTGVVLSLFDSTSNDLLAAIPFVWALALAMYALRDPDTTQAKLHIPVICSGIFAGISVAFKLSNGPLALLLPGLWMMAGWGIRRKAINLMAGCLAATIGFLLAYGYWGWQLWSHFGSPIYPLYDYWLQPLRDWAGWKP